MAIKLSLVHLYEAFSMKTFVKYRRFKYIVIEIFIICFIMVLRKATIIKEKDVCFLINITNTMSEPYKKHIHYWNILTKRTKQCILII